LGDLTLDIYLPADFEGTMDVKVTSGAVSSESFNLENFRIKASSGNLTADTINAASVAIQTTSGNIDIKRINADRLAITTHSGNITSGQSTVGEASVEATSGNVEMAGLTGNINLKTTSGKTILSYPRFDKNNLVVGTTSGSVTLRLPANAGFLLAARSNSGKIQSDFSIDDVEGGKINKTTGQVGTGTGQIKINTTSGSIQLRIEK
jgi:DUF4097 and DUF4098 domain-containing protein YvlB